MATEKIRLSTYVDPEVNEKIKLLAERSGLSASSYLAVLLNEHVRQSEAAVLAGDPKTAVRSLR